jgi:hypothetical protein
MHSRMLPVPLQLTHKPLNRAELQVLRTPIVDCGSLSWWWIHPLAMTATSSTLPHQSPEGKARILERMRQVAGIPAS